jgi:ribose 5-phosphate isomerase B
LETIVARISIASDHAGYHLKELLKAYLIKKGFSVSDFGTDSDLPVDYPDYILPAARSVAEGKNDFGIVLGGSGNGEAIVANKVSGIRCALCWNEQSARLAKKHNNANMISIGARMVSKDEAVIIVDTWLKTEFEYDRHERRIDKIKQAELKGN